MAEQTAPRPWAEIPADRQTALLVEYGYYLDSLPPTCSLETKEQRFRSWLQERGISYP
ncbi:MAG: hypothetical protein KDH88_06985 [Chromatiales bacterium]|nr:hypothetical protein [Chromatiales bacterium]